MMAKPVTALSPLRGARPNILMFGDSPWVPDRTHAQHKRYKDFLNTILNRPSSMKVVIECGAGIHIPTARGASEDLMRAGFHLIRINPNDDEIPNHCQAKSVGLPLGALQALRTDVELSRQVAPTAGLQNRT